MQGPYFDDTSLAHLTGGGSIDAYSLNLALTPFNISLHRTPHAHDTIPAHEEKAFLCYQHQRWFALRRIGKHWLNLSDVIQRPAQIVQKHLSISLSQLREDGCEVYVVRGTLPKCDADDDSFWRNDFIWVLGGGVVGDDDDEEECLECGVPLDACGCDPDEAFQDDLQRAIEESLKDVSVASKPLVIKSSPPMSLVSTEADVSGLELEKRDEG